MKKTSEEFTHLQFVSHFLNCVRENLLIGNCLIAEVCSGFDESDQFVRTKFSENGGWCISIKYNSPSSPTSSSGLLVLKQNLPGKLDSDVNQDSV